MLVHINQQLINNNILIILNNKLYNRVKQWYHLSDLQDISILHFFRNSRRCIKFAKMKIKHELVQISYREITHNGRNMFALWFWNVFKVVNNMLKKSLQACI